MMNADVDSRPAARPDGALDVPVWIVSLSGGRDSGAVGVWVARQWAEGRIRGDLRYVFADVGPRMEPDTRPWVAEYERVVLQPLGLRVEIVEATRRDTAPGWDAIFERPNRQPILPGPLHRSCTQHLKIEPMRRWRKTTLGDRVVTWIIGFRADERNRSRVAAGEWDVDRYTGESIWRPFVGLGFGLPDVRAILASAGLREPSCYEWTTRSGCVFCFYKPRRELAAAAVRYPAEFAHLAAHEAKVIGKAGKRGASPYVITKGGTLLELVAAERAQLPLFDLDAWDERACGDALRTCEL